MNYTPDLKYPINKIEVCAALLILILSGVFIRICGLNEWMFNSDDVLHLSYGAAPTALATFHTALWHNTHSPGFFVILHYMLKISQNELFLRCVALVPGVALIPSFYVLGNCYKGRVAGLFMAFIATFSVELVLVSEVIRQYSLLLLLECWALYALLCYDKTKKPSHLIWYGLLSLVAIHVHYTAVIFIAACGIIWFITIAFQEKNKRDIIIWMVIHAILAAMFLVIFIMKYQTHTLQTDMQYAVNEFAFRGFPSDVWGVVTILFYLVFFNHHPYGFLIALPLMFAVTMFGYIQAIEKKEYKILGLIGVALGVNVIVTLAKLYPLGMGRNCLYLVPLTLLPLASAVQDGVDYIYVRYQQPGEDKRWRGILLPMVIFLGMIGYGVIDAHQKSFYRDSRANNFSITKYQYNTALNYLLNVTQKGDIIITERFVVDYLFYENKSRHDDKIVGNIHHLTYKGRELYYTDETSACLLFWYISDLQDFLQQLSLSVPAIKHQQLWFFSLGQASIFNLFLKEDVSHAEVKNQSAQAIALAKLSHEFTHSDQVNHRLMMEGLNVETGFNTNWQFLEKTLLDPEALVIFHEKKARP